ncbi:hypothetical protein [Micromonospora sp. NPDC007230]|uniref:hypothetical protein n=1 Tax=Micromonospora sp. NPDC007230 TaxID=3364237 RepID=UPI0036C20596
MRYVSIGAAVNIETLVRSLGYESTLAVVSSDQLVDEVLKYAKEHAGENDAYRYSKQPTPIPVGPGVRTSPAQVLHELGVATTLLDASPLAQVARHWAHVRYCTTLTAHRGHLALSRHAGNVVYHHKVTQSEQLGIGLALVVAKALLRRQHPGWDFHAVDAEVALKAGFLDGVGDVETTSKTKKRPDYILLGHHSSGRRSRVKIVILECKGTHQAASFAYGQLARAAVQVDALRVGGRGQPSLMVASCLSKTRITSYVLDPPGDEELWSGADNDLDELLSASPDDQDWRPRPAPPDEARRWELPAEPAGPAAETSLSPAEDLPPGAPDVFDIPAERRGWFTQILTRAAAATALLFAGNNAAARDYATPRQRGEPPAPEPPALFELDPPWESSTARTLHLPDGLSAEGTRYRAPLPGGKTLEVFRGVDADLYRQLTEGRIGPYLRAAPRAYRRWSASRPDQGVRSVGRDGTVLVVRLADRDEF